jgi:hypothetical protein
MRNHLAVCGILEARATITCPRALLRQQRQILPDPPTSRTGCVKIPMDFVAPPSGFAPPQRQGSLDPLRGRAALGQLGEAAGSRSARTSFRIRNGLHRNHRQVCPNLCPGCREHVQTLVRRSGTARKSNPFWTKNLDRGFRPRPIQSGDFSGRFKLISINTIDLSFLALTAATPLYNPAKLLCKALGFQCKEYDRPCFKAVPTTTRVMSVHNVTLL